MAGFMVKVPVWPFHTWLPAAYAEAPTGVTMLLSALLAKLGTFGILRFVLPLTPDAALAVRPAGGRHARRVRHRVRGALRLRPEGHQAGDRVQLGVAPGVPGAGLFAFNAEGLTGAVLHMVNHGSPPGRCSPCWASSSTATARREMLAVRRADGPVPELRGADVRARAWRASACRG